jgi:hypothetical protein
LISVELHSPITAAACIETRRQESTHCVVPGDNHCAVVTTASTVMSHIAAAEHKDQSLESTFSIFVYRLCRREASARTACRGNVLRAKENGRGYYTPAFRPQ